MGLSQTVRGEALTLEQFAALTDLLCGGSEQKDKGERGMSQEIRFTYPSADRITYIQAMMWIPDGKIRGILQISHGMLEFVERYGEFARFLNRHGILTVGNDHLGHGGSVRSEAYYGYFAEKNGNKILLSDMRELQRMTQEKYPDLPYFLLGHSMGSFLARQYLCQYGNYLDGAIICGTAWHSGLEARAGMLLCRLIARGKGWRYRSHLVNRLAIGSFNRNSIRPARPWTGCPGMRKRWTGTGATPEPSLFLP